MKVVIINTYSKKGGAAIASSRLADALSKESTIEVSRISLNENTFYHKWANLVRIGIEKLVLGFYINDKKNRFQFSMANTGIDISSRPEVKNADIIHLHWINNGLLSFASLEKLKKLKKPIVWTLHDMWAFTGGCHYSRECENYKVACGNCIFLKNPNTNDLSHFLFKKKQQAYEGLSLSLVTCSHWLKRLASESTLLRELKITTIPNPIDTLLFKPVDKELVRKKYGISLTKKILLFSAASIHDTRKGFRYLEEALILLSKKNPTLSEDVELLIIGKSTGTRSILPFKITYAGFISDSSIMAEYYGLSDVYILPSTEDNLPNTVLEAMACGTPVVGFDVGGVSDMITHGENGYLALPSSAESLSKGIETILEQQKKGVLYLEVCRASVINKFSENIITKQYFELYTSLLTK